MMIILDSLDYSVQVQYDLIVILSVGLSLNEGVTNLETIKLNITILIRPNIH